MAIDKKKRPAGGETKQGNSSNTTNDIIDENPQKSKPGGKNRYWVGVLYPENMRPDWEAEIGDLVELPYAYCKHTVDRDTMSEHRKDHVHLILVWPNTTTYNNAMTVFSKLSADGKKALNRIEAVINIRSKYEYLIHNTETCRKKGKELYPPDQRITGNNFDIGAYEQVGVAEKNDMCRELCKAIMDNGFTNFGDFFEFVMMAYGEDLNYFEIVKTYSGLFERLTKSNYQKWQNGQLFKEHVTVTENEDTDTTIIEL